MEQFNRYDHGSLLKDRYLKVADISEGSYGLVSLAKDVSQDDRLVAVKFIFPIDYKRTKEIKELSKTGRATSSPAKLRSNAPSDKSRSHNTMLKTLYEETNKEIRIHQILGAHENITKLIDHFDSYLVLEYCPRGDLYEAIQNGLGPSTSQDIKDVFSQILNALEFCHSNFVYHRDLKPENILIDHDWTIKICDWGLATTERTITNKAEFDIGSERYMAPELFDREQESYDAAKVDLWSVGVILLTLVFHKNPFQSANYTDKRFLQFSANREALFDFFSSMTGEMFSALRYCLNIDPSNRDLDSLRRELNYLNFFTIDEEYWAAHSDEEDMGYEEDVEEEHNVPLKPTEGPEDIPESDSDDEMFKFDNEAREPPAPEAIVTSPKAVIGPHILIDDDSKLVDSTSDASTALESSTLQRDESMPYNRRADALLSPIVGARPIPINAGKGLIRNTRKPFGVASIHKGAFSTRQGVSHHGNINSGSFGAKFRREDFFTPKSVFNHYMDKYGEQREAERSEKDKRKRWKRGRKKQSWKRTNGHDNQRNGQSHTTSKRQNVSSASHRNETASRRKYPNGKRRTRPESMQSPQLHAQTFSRVNGKYVPPNLRSPYMKMADSLPEDVDNLNLNDDPVFHLEGDFSTPTQGKHHSRNSKDMTSSNLAKKPIFAAAYNQFSDSNSLSSPKTALNGDEKGKYIPPFRRGSHTGAFHPPTAKAVNVISNGAHHTPLSGHSYLQDLHGDGNSIKRRSFQPDVGNTLMAHQTEETSRSVPGRSWLLEGKNWSDFD